MKTVSNTVVTSAGIIIGYIITLVIVVPMLESILFN